MTPDGVRYMTASVRPVPRPFQLRWLLPALFGQRELAWRWCSRGSVVAVGVLAAVYAGSPWMACVAFLPGVAFNWRHTILVDAPGMALALAAALLWQINPWAAVAVAVVAGCVRETAPVWAGIYAWNPALLLGLLPVVVRWGMRVGPDPCGYDEALRHPIRSARQSHKGHGNVWAMVAPWGPFVVALGALDGRLAAALAAAYGQLLIATDEVRLYQWAAPVVALAAVVVVPAQWLPLFALAVVFNPWKGSGL